jgi:tetratricopeptide (TPR) repeat protein
MGRKRKDKQYKQQKKQIKQTSEFVFVPLVLSVKIVGIVVFLSALFVYLRTLTPTVNLHDSGEMISAAAVLGICHPPGYPLYCIVGKLLTIIIPMGNIAFRMNIFSGISAAITVMMVYFITLKVCSSISIIKNNTITGIHKWLCIISGIIAAGMLCFATTFWQQATIAEKYTLNAMFLTILMFIIIKLCETKDKNYIYLFSAVAGLSFTHHLQTIFIVPASIYLILVLFWDKKHMIFNIRTMIKVGICFCIPLLMYIYLPIRAATHPVINWGCPDTWERFINHITVREYGYYFTTTLNDIFVRMFREHPLFFIKQFPPYIIWLGIIGAIWLVRTNWRFSVFLALIVIADISHSVRYGIHNIEDYYIPSYIIVAICIGLSVIPIMQVIRSRISSDRIYCLLSGAFLILPVTSFYSNLYYANNHRNFYSYDYGRNILMPLEKDAILFVKGDTFAFPLWYLYYIERIRDDICLVDHYSLYLDWYATQLKEHYPELNFTFVPQNKVHRLSPAAEPYIYGRLANIVDNNIHRASYLPFDKKVDKMYSLVPTGICHRIFPKDTSIETQIKAVDPNFKFVCRYILDERIYKPERTASNIANYGISYNNRGKFFYDNHMYLQAIKEFKKANAVAPEYVTPYYQLGLVYKDMKRYDEAIEEFEKIKKISPEDANKAYYGIGMVYHAMRRFDKAIENYKKAIQLDPKRDFLYAMLGSAYLEVNNIHAAIEMFQKVVELTPQSPDAYYNLGIAYSRAGDMNNAIQCYQQALKLKPGYIPVLRALNQIAQQ